MDNYNPNNQTFLADRTLFFALLKTIARTFFISTISSTDRIRNFFDALDLYLRQAVLTRTINVNDIFEINMILSRNGIVYDLNHLRQIITL